MNIRKFSFKMLLAGVLSVAILGGSFAPAAYAKSVPKKGKTTQSAAMPAAMRKALRMSNSQWEDKLGDLDLCVGDLVFTDSKKISSDTLFTFFSYITQSSEYPKNYINRWYSKKDKKYHVPVSDILKVLNKYFNGANFNPAKIYGYNKETKKIDCIVDGFGGGRFPKLSGKTIVSNNTLRITIKYYDEFYKKVEFTKGYTIRYSNTGYKYLSIIEK